MKRILGGAVVLGAALVLCLTGSARAQSEEKQTQNQSVDEQIQELKQKLATLESRQVEMKKEATAAAAALPTFEFRPGNGVMIEAADKSWAFRASIEAHFRMLFEHGLSRAGRTDGEVMGRRFRPYFYYCINNCLWEIEAGLDMDGFGTGNAKNSTATTLSSILQRGAVHFHAEQLNPFLPTADIGMDISTTGAAAISRQGSSAVGVQREYDLMTRNVSLNTGRAGQGINLRWDDRSLSSIGIPGRISRLSMAMASISEGDDGLSSFKDAGDNFDAYIGINPFSQTNNKWIRGLLFEFGTWACDNKGYRGATDNGCTRVRMQDHGDAGRQVLFDTGADSVGKGWYNTYSPGITWTIGPYRLRTMGMFLTNSGSATASSSPNVGRKKSAHNFLIGNDLFLWSPKGWLTGSPTTVGSVLIGYSYEHNNLACHTCTGGSFSGPNGFHQNSIILNQWGMAYFFAPRWSVLANFLWYRASNLPQTAETNLDLNNNPKSGGQWVDSSLTLRVDF